MKFFKSINNNRIVLLIFIVFISCNEDNRNKTGPAILPGEKDKINLTDLNGKTISLKQYQGKTIFINFWATWCKPCIQEMPSIRDLQDSLKNKEIIFILASDEDIDEIKEFRNAHDYKFNYVRIENSEELNLKALPTTFIFNRNGDKVFAETGARKWNDKNSIDTILKIATNK